jgi:branched-subunit amino acid aminotransferase/4-amino-4-deoxychorismate lyase
MQGCLQTPDLASGCLPGVTREVVLELAREAGLTVHEAPLSAETRGSWDEAFLTNSLLDVAPLVQVDGLLIGNGPVRPLTRMLAERYCGLVARGG